MKKDLNQRYLRLAELGCAIRRGRNNHLQVEFPDGRRRSMPSTSKNFHVLRDLDKEISRLESAKLAGVAS